MARYIFHIFHEIPSDHEAYANLHAMIEKISESINIETNPVGHWIEVCHIDTDKTREELVDLVHGCLNEFHDQFPIRIEPLSASAMVDFVFGSHKKMPYSSEH
jgi:hypothetical protein